MIHVRPFRAWRPAAHTAHLVGSRSFLTYTLEQLREKLAGNPYSFLHIVHADHDRAGLSRAEHFNGVREKFMEFIQRGILLRDDLPAYYLYEQSCEAFTTRGLIATVSVADYQDGKVKVHEQTLTTREELFKDYLNFTGINAEPVLLAVPDADAFDQALVRIAQGQVMYDFCTTDQVRHRFWRVDDTTEVEAIRERFAAMDAVYIADGHHRCASSARLAETTGAQGEDPKAWFLAYLVPEPQLHIFNFDRLVKGLNGLSDEALVERLAQVGQLTPFISAIEAPERGSVRIYTRKGWWTLVLPPSDASSVVDNLDATRLAQSILGPVLGITDLRTDPRITFVPGTHGTIELERKVLDGTADIAFHLRSVDFNELKAVADSGGCMPPKTTWIEPKLRSGLTIYPLEG